jgi:hypothetical protein
MLIQNLSLLLWPPTKEPLCLVGLFQLNSFLYSIEITSIRLLAFLKVFWILQLPLAFRFLLIVFLFNGHIQDQIFNCLHFQFGFLDIELFHGAVLTLFERSVVKS